MTTIPPFAAGSYAASRKTSQLLSLKSQLNDLTTQLTSGRTAETYGGLGSGRTTALAAQASISALTGYNAVITTAQTRTKLAVSSLTQVATVGSSTNTTLQNGLQSVTASAATARSAAVSNLSAALDALNQSDGSVYLFGGRNGSTPPVLDAETILNGTTDTSGTQLDGLTTVVQEQVNADLGTNGNGRLTQAQTGTSVSLQEDASARATPAFGFSIAGVTASNPSSIAVTQTSATSPVSYAVNVAAQPTTGDKVTYTLGLPDGTKTTVTLTAATTADPTSTLSFAIGPDTATTAANLSTTLGNALKAAGSGPLSASATARASTNFFNGSVQGNVTPQRVYYDATTGQPSYTHTANSTTAVKKTVLWYQGDDSNTDARASQTIQIGSSATVQVGARANEAPIRSVLAGLATVALGMPSSGATNANGIYQAVVTQATPLLSAANTSPSVQDMVSDFSLASARMTNAASANTAQQSTLQDTIDGIEQASTEEVATKLMDLQTRLQASYQVTSSLSKLSLVNYLS